ncbi:hypothetical protein HPB50_007256 [Hyalomma asiaticum]|uniref:Uncharacterized protein n=1 Tax=Hyalomma asiaticum TaxID=266040 RepID=A0ACB7TG75_HYAAI|nr:hypothetical protein HPB50_007256 [Hyalomma asiaticum]
MQQRETVDKHDRAATLGSTKERHEGLAARLGEGHEKQREGGLFRLTAGSYKELQTDDGAVDTHREHVMRARSKRTPLTRALFRCRRLAWALD